MGGAAGVSENRIRSQDRYCALGFGGALAGTSALRDPLRREVPDSGRGATAAAPRRRFSKAAAPRLAANTGEAKPKPALSEAKRFGARREPARQSRSPR